MDIIRPLSDLKYKYSEISKICKESSEAVFITVNGRCDTVILSYENYLKQQAEFELLRNLAEAEEDVRLKRLEKVETSFNELRDRLK